MSWILTFTGREVDLLDPRPGDIHIEDIAHALANIARFNGHTHRFYSVAEHSVVMSRKVPPSHALDALLHDAAEAFLADVPTPLKDLLPGYRELEARMEVAIRTRFGLFHKSPAIREADLRMLATEREQLLPDSVRPWPILEDVETYDTRLMCWDPEWAKECFLARYRQITFEEVTS